MCNAAGLGLYTRLQHYMAGDVKFLHTGVELELMEARPRSSDRTSKHTK